MSEGDIRQEAAYIFKKAAQYIRRYGWRVSGMSEHGLPRCSMGALASAHQAKVWDNRLSKLMYDELYEELGGLTLTEFNYLHKDGDKVATLFEKAAARLNSSSAIQYADARA